MTRSPLTDLEVQVVERFRLVCSQSSLIDPANEEDWHSLSLGFFIAKGLLIEDAKAMACYVKYTLLYWPDDQLKYQGLKWLVISASLVAGRLSSISDRIRSVPRSAARFVGTRSQSIQMGMGAFWNVV